MQKQAVLNYGGSQNLGNHRQEWADIAKQESSLPREKGSNSHGKAASNVASRQGAPRAVGAKALGWVNPQCSIIVDAFIVTAGAAIGASTEDPDVALQCTDKIFL